MGKKICTVFFNEDACNVVSIAPPSLGGLPVGSSAPLGVRVLHGLGRGQIVGEKFFQYSKLNNVELDVDRIFPWDAVCPDQRLHAVQSIKIDAERKIRIVLPHFSEHFNLPRVQVVKLISLFG